jgi:hypothetical protein
MDYRVIKQFPNYEFYEDGTVWRKQHTTVNGIRLKRMQLCPYVTKNRYMAVALHDKNGKIMRQYLHRIIYQAFFGEIPPNYEIDHIDSNKANCAVQNLRLSTHKANCNNPSSIAKYKEANALDKGKFNREKMINAQGKEAYAEAVKVYKRLVKEYGTCGTWKLMKEARIGYQRACKIVNENEMGGSE